MNFMEAVKVMKEGKKVKRKAWEIIFCIKDCSTSINGIWINEQHKGHEYCPDYNDIEATDWQIYEEEDKWNLADKKHPMQQNLVSIDDIITFIQKVKEDIMIKIRKNTGDRLDSEEFKEIIDKRLGDLK